MDILHLHHFRHNSSQCVLVGPMELPMEDFRHRPHNRLLNHSRPRIFISSKVSSSNIRRHLSNLPTTIILILIIKCFLLHHHHHQIRRPLSISSSSRRRLSTAPSTLPPELPIL